MAMRFVETAPFAPHRCVRCHAGSVEAGPYADLDARTGEGAVFVCRLCFAQVVGLADLVPLETHLEAEQRARRAEERVIDVERQLEAAASEDLRGRHEDALLELASARVVVQRQEEIIRELRAAPPAGVPTPAEFARELAETATGASSA